VNQETIAAIATAAGPAGVGIIRLSGPRAIAIAAEALGIEESSLDRNVRVGWATDRAGTRIDRVIAFAMRAPSSFTGEDVAEIQGHGGSHNLGKLLATVVERGARVAEPGEFTRRAVASGKLDLLRAEALLDVIAAGSDRSWRLAQDNLSGKIGLEAEAIEKRALIVLAELEGWIDFPEEDLEIANATWIATEISALQSACARLADGFRHGRAVSRGITVALVGPVNVGKSSLLNALVGTERALVAPEPGTTRDWLEVSDVWNGVSVTLVDTAGLRESGDATAGAIEQRGIALGQARVASADVVVVVNDGFSGWDDGTRFGERAVVVRSKADLGGASSAALMTSATRGQGLEELKHRVLEVAGVADREGSEQAFVTTARQQGLAATAREAFAAAAETWAAKRPPEVIAVELRHGSQTLAQLRGIEVGDRVLDEVFARFCIGK